MFFESQHYTVSDDGHQYHVFEWAVVYSQGNNKHSQTIEKAQHSLHNGSRATTMTYIANLNTLPFAIILITS